MPDCRISKLARLIVGYSVAVKPGDKVLIRGSVNAAPLLNEIYASVLISGGHPLMQPVLPDLEELLYAHASESQLAFVPPPTMLGIATYDVAISVMGALNTKGSSVDPGKENLVGESRRDLSDTFRRRAATGDLRWTTVLYLTHAYAQAAEMSLDDYEDFVYRACLPDQADPVAYWQALSAQQAEIVERLQGCREITVQAPGTNLTVRVEGRSFINCDGHVNMPDGEIFTGPVEDSAEDYVSFTYPVVFQGREMTGVRLEFKGGIVVKATADQNEDDLNRVLDMDEGARRLGEFAIGTNKSIQRFTKQTLFDEKMGGSFHIALGAGYPETGSRNRSSIHWDMISDLRDGGQIWADGVLLYQNGRFVVSRP